MSRVNKEDTYWEAHMLSIINIVTTVTVIKYEEATYSFEQETQHCNQLKR
uniref:Uncharacterized protein n=1 Tax=Arion vulgaris TaxID=1028688 RepID=A0A0B7AEV8_9EUPU